MVDRQHLLIHLKEKIEEYVYINTNEKIYITD